MPLVRIDVLSEPNADRLPAIGDAVHQAMTETIDVPVDDRFQIMSSHAAGRLRYDPGYFGVQRDDGIVYIAITMRAGRTDEQKTALYRRATELIAEAAGIEPRNVFFSLTENHEADWSFGEGVAHMLPSKP
ncbi:tautomerase family protein [Amycolatopsis rubida]|uniref:Tautomerase enzyme n=1 Tax=Amycolatopsis rubida TaxID=112413 RepID=A0A1I5YE58_9PSEU|nr:tautomerase family protein [Amycolatopsis rubida]SFQ42486.1 Tautomerase enzyme [Amycolatopsis rubida]